mgnify:CR=1 FL=1
MIDAFMEQNPNITVTQNVVIPGAEAGVEVESR